MAGGAKVNPPNSTDIINVLEREEDFEAGDAEADNPEISQEEFKKLLKKIFKDYPALALESPEELFKSLNDRALDTLTPEMTRFLYSHVARQNN
jgi:hypothetical protein